MNTSLAARRSALLLCVTVCASSIAHAAPLPRAVGAQVLAAAPSAEADQQALTQGVREIAAPGLPGAVSVWGAGFPLVAGKLGGQADAPLAPVVAALHDGKARVVAFGHDGFLNPEALQVGDTGRLLLNALSWAGSRARPRVATFDLEPLNAWLREQKQDVRAVDLDQADDAALQDVDVLVVNGHRLSDKHEALLRAWIERGGGLVAATTGWGWNYNTPEKDLARDFVLNRLLAPHGLAWSTSTLNRTSTNGFSVQPSPPASTWASTWSLMRADAALDAAQSLIRGGQDGGQVLEPGASSQLRATLEAVMSGLPPQDSLWNRMRALASGGIGDVVPMLSRPVRREDGAARLLLTLQTQIAKSLPPDQVKPHPAGAIFPGDVPPNDKAVTKAIEVDLSVPGWHSTGLYAAPGAKISVALPEAARALGLSVRIGCHTDTLYQLDEWKRAPDISRQWPLSQAQTSVANPFGGLVYIVAPDKVRAEKIEATVSGGHTSPLFQLGVTSLDGWKRVERWKAGPWAEVQGRNAIITVPSRDVRDLDDPVALVKLYDDALDAMADMVGISRVRARPERIVCDAQISAGYMHSGYPVMTWLDVEKKSVDEAALRRESWGHWHEFGHNHQASDWTFEGTGEVTNNILALYVWDTVLHRPREEAHPNVKRAWFESAWKQYVAGGRSYEKLKSDPFLFLHLYITLQEQFGWEPFKKVFAEYRTLKPEERPQNDEQKRDQWMVRMSRAVGRNLGPYFERWNVPTSQAARDSIKDLPAWTAPGLG